MWLCLVDCCIFIYLIIPYSYYLVVTKGLFMLVCGAFYCGNVIFYLSYSSK